MPVTLGASSSPEEEKVIWAENITYLAKEQGIKLMELADEVGVAVSFFSRARKGDSRADANVLSKMAARLGVGLDTLMNCDLTSMTGNERLVLNFLDKIIVDTNEEKLQWIKDPIESMTALTDEGEAAYPVSETIETADGRKAKYKSRFERKRQSIYVTGDGGYHAAMSKETGLYIIQVGMREEPEDEGGRPNFLAGKELYISDFLGINPVCSTFNGTNRDVVKRINDLYGVARLKSDHIVLDGETAGIMTDYLQGTLDKRYELPF